MATMSAMSPDDVVTEKYDFVIIGGGTAGLTVAARLTEDANINVLVLEAGENKLNDPKINIPALMIQLYEDPDYDWGFKTVPQIDMNNRIVAQTRGKVLGGSSAINFMMLSHASKLDIDNWAKLGNPGWSFDEMLPYYRKFETYNAPDEEIGKALGSEIIDKSLHGSSGPVQITFPHGITDVDATWRTTHQTLNLGAEQDPKLGDTLGGYAVLKYIDMDAKRSYAASAFYAPNAGRQNLTVLTGAHVTRVLFENKSDNGPRATGVKFSISEKDYIASASSEVILSAGAFQSPQILELSGIGCKKLLQKHDVKVVVDNPNVGENLQDHVLVPLEFETIDGVPTAETIKQPGVLEWSLNEWQSGRGGPLATGPSGTSFLSYPSILPSSTSATLLQSVSNDLNDETPSPIRSKSYFIQKAVFLNKKEADLQFTFARTGFNPYNSESLASLFQHEDPGNYVGSVAVLTHPFSRGSVHINSADSKASPRIDPRYLSNPLDLGLLADGMLFIQTLMETPPLSKFIKDASDGNGKKIQPSFQIETKLDRAAAVEFVKRAAISSWHPIGTCAMLPREEGGVVDPRLRVYGVKGLRVVDASVMPLHVRGNIASAVYAIAERAADLIKEDFVKKV